MTYVHNQERAKWDKDGYAAVPAAIPRDLVATFDSELRNLWDNPDPTCKVHAENDGTVLISQAKNLDLSHHHYRILDLHKHLPSAQAIGNHPGIMNAFVSLFGRTPRLCQSLTFEYPSEQPLHQDWCFVTTCAPDVPSMIGVWVALDPVDEDNGPLQYFPGSHTMPRYNYSSATHDGFKPYLDTQVVHIQPKLFLAQPGDVLLWHGDLAHAGSPALNKNKRRLSMILHYSFESPGVKDRVFRAIKNILR